MCVCAICENERIEFVGGEPTNYGLATIVMAHLAHNKNNVYQGGVQRSSPYREGWEYDDLIMDRKSARRYGWWRSHCAKPRKTLAHKRANKHLKQELLAA